MKTVLKNILNNFLEYYRIEGRTGFMYGKKIKIETNESDNNIKLFEPETGDFKIITLNELIKLVRENESLSKILN